MSNIVQCPYCQKQLRLPATGNFNALRCPGCKEVFKPEDASEPEAITVRPEPEPQRPLFSESGYPRESEEPRRSERSIRKREPSSSSAGKWLLVLLLLGAIGGGVTWYLERQKKRRIAREDLRQRRENIREALVDQKPIDEKKIAAEITPIFQSLGAAFRAEDGSQAVVYFDADRMYDQMEAYGNIPAQIRRNKRNFIRGMKIGMTKSFTQNAPLLAWSTFEIRHIKKLSENDIVVIVKHRDAQTLLSKMRWWLSRQSGSWKVYDMEDLDVNLRTTAEMHTLMTTVDINDRRRFQEIQELVQVARQAALAMTQGQFDVAEKQLKLLRARNLPSTYRILERLFTGTVHLNHGESEKALQCYQQAQAMNPDMPGLDFLRGIAYNQLEQWDKALKHVQAYRDLLGDDEGVCLQMGEALYGLQRYDEAAKQYRASLDFDANNPDAYLGLLFSLSSEDNLDDVQKRFAQLKDHHDVFDVMAEELLTIEHYHVLEPMALAMKKISPNHPSLYFYLAMSRAHAGDSSQATAHFKQMLVKERDAKTRDELADDFLEKMIEMDFPLEAYQVAPNPRKAFERIASELMHDYTFYSLRALVRDFQKKQPQHMLLPFYRGAIHVNNGNYDRAHQEFENGLKRPPKASELQPFRSYRITAHYGTGQALEAYREIGPREETFTQLANLMLQNKQLDPLQSLLEEHRKQSPNSVEGLRYSFRLKIRQKKLDPAIQDFQKALQLEKDTRKQSVLRNQFYTDMIEAGEILKAYHALPDPQKSFESLAGRMRQYNLDAKPFEELIKAHQSEKPRSLLLGCYQATLLSRKKEWKKALTAYEKAWKELPESARPAFQRDYILVLYHNGKALEAYQQFKPGALKELANLFYAEKDDAGLEKLLEAVDKTEADDADVYLYQARVKLLRGDVGGAAPLAQKAFEATKEQYRRDRIVREWVRATMAMGKALQGYQLSPDRKLAFATIARQYLVEKNVKDLNALLEEHGKAHADDPNHARYRGELALLQNKPQEAEAILEKELKPGPKANQWQLRDALARVKVRLGKVVEAYRAWKDEGVFTQLATICSREKKADQLEALVKEHARLNPEAEELRQWQLEVEWLKKNYAQVVALAKAKTKDLNPPIPIRIRSEYQLRSLLRLDRKEEAIQEATALTERFERTWNTRMLAYAVLGKVDRMLKEASRWERYGDTMQQLYEDEDLKPYLLSPAMAKFREKYPPKKK